jgi:hypothetical protein
LGRFVSEALQSQGLLEPKAAMVDDCGRRAICRSHSWALMPGEGVPAVKHQEIAALVIAGALAAAGQVLAAEAPDAPMATAPTPIAAAAADTSAASPVAAPPPIATPPQGGSGVAEQIDRYLRSSPAARLPDDETSGVTTGQDEPRKVHGVVDVSVGSGGYRSYYARSDVPLGKTGTLSIAIGQTQFNGRSRGYGGYGGYGYGSPYRYGYGGPYNSQSLALGLSFGGSTLGDRPGRCRTAWSDPRTNLDEQLPVAADRFAGCPYGEPSPEGR